MNVAIWGGTGQVGQALRAALARRGANCHAYARDVRKAERLLPSGRFSPFGEFPSRRYDLLINAVSAGAGGARALFETLEKWDWRLIEFAKEQPGCACVSISSGAVYGPDFAAPAEEGTAFALAPNRVEAGRVYGLVKLMCEERHRAHPDLPLADLRLYAFFTRYMDFDQPFFMSDVMKAARSGNELITPATDFHRDFAHPDDFADLVARCAERRVNAAYDLYSRAPIRKSEILAAFAERYGLRYSAGGAWQSLTGDKAHYYSNYRKAAELGYEPRFASRDALIGEADAILRPRQTPKD